MDNGGNIVELREKPWLPVHATIGILTINTEVLPKAEEELGTSFDIMAHLIPWLIKEGHKVKAYIHEGPWYDIGSLERYQKLPEEEFPEFLNRQGAGNRGPISAWRRDE